MAFCGQCGAASSGGSFCAQCGAATGSSAKSSAEISAPTTYENRCEILAQLWIEHKNDEEFEDFINLNDIGLPLAYAVSTEIVSSTKKAELFINETFENLLVALSIQDSAYVSLSHLLGFEDDEDEEE